MLSFSNINAQVSGAQLMSELGVLAGNASRLASLYLDLGGDRGLSWGRNIAPSVIAADIQERITSTIDSEVEKAVNGICEAYGKKQTLNVDTYMVSSFESQTIVGIVELENFYAIAIKFTEKLKKDLPLWELVRLLLYGLKNTGVCASEYDLLSDHVEMCEEEPCGEDDQDGYGEIRKSLEKTKAYFSGTPRCRKGVAVDIMAAYDKVKDRLTDRQRLCVESTVAVIRFFDSYWKDFRRSSTKKGAVNLFEDERFSSLRERPAPDLFMHIVWDGNDVSSHYLSEDLNSLAGEHGPPVLIRGIEGGNDLVMFCRLVEHMAMLQNIFFDFEEVWHAARRRRKSDVKG